MAKVLIEDRRKVHAGVLVAVRDDVFGEDVVIFEVLIEVVEQLHQAASLLTTLRRVLSMRAPLKYLSSGVRR